MMKHLLTVESLVLGLLLFLSVGCVTAAAAHPGETPFVTAAKAETAAPSGHSCAAPLPESIARCREMEAAILAVTVRLELTVYSRDGNGAYTYEDSSLGHGTVVAGRFIVTHNHFRLSLADLQDGKLRYLSLYTAGGDVLVKDALFHTFEVVVAEPETLVFDFGNYGRQGLLTYVNLASADFRQAPDLQPGMEVAQVSWDGAATRVQWVRVTGSGREGDTPVIRLDGTLEQGASGGGVFYNGYHVANNWFRSREVTVDTGQMVQEFTVAALNTAGLMALADAAPGHSTIVEDVAEVAHSQLDSTGVTLLSQ